MTFVLVLVAAIGLALGSFGNVMVHRINAATPLLGRSACPSCARTIRWFDLVPVLSYALLRGKCRSCSKHISLRYPVIELLSMAVFLFAMWTNPEDPVRGFLTAFALYFLLLACAYDFEHQQLPDIFTAGIFAFALLRLLFTGGDMVSLLQGAALGASWFGIQWLITSGRAVGSGDILLAGAIGALLGLRDTVVMLVLSYMTGAIIVITLLGLRKVRMTKNARIAFGPFLGLATMLTLAGAGDAYLSLFF